MTFAMNHEMLMKQTSCYRHIFPCEPSFMAQMLKVFLPLTLEI